MFRKLNISFVLLFLFSLTPLCVTAKPPRLYVGFEHLLKIEKEFVCQEDTLYVYKASLITKSDSPYIETLDFDTKGLVTLLSGAPLVVGQYVNCMTLRQTLLQLEIEHNFPEQKTTITKWSTLIPAFVDEQDYSRAQISESRLDEGIICYSWRVPLYAGLIVPLSMNKDNGHD